MLGCHYCQFTLHLPCKDNKKEQKVYSSAIEKLMEGVLYSVIQVSDYGKP